MPINYERTLKMTREDLVDIVPISEASDRIVPIGGAHALCWNAYEAQSSYEVFMGKRA